MKPALKKNDSQSTDGENDKAPSLSELLKSRRAPTSKTDEFRTVDVVDGFDDTVRWPLWKTAALVVSVCLTFWIGVAFLISYLLS